MKDQRVIVYGRGRGKAVVYDTAYSDEEVREVIMRCVSRYGRTANVRSMSAAERWRERLKGRS